MQSRCVSRCARVQIHACWHACVTAVRTCQCVTVRAPVRVCAAGGARGSEGVSRPGARPGLGLRVCGPITTAGFTVTVTASASRLSKSLSQLECHYQDLAQVTVVPTLKARLTRKRHQCTKASGPAPPSDSESRVLTEPESQSLGPGTRKP